jgi:hypothetical protein
MSVALASFIPRVRNPNTRTLKTNLVSHWSLEEASGSRADDFGSNTLTPTGAPGNATGKIGQAAQFVAASSQYLSIADNAALSMGDIDFSVGAWVYLDSGTGNPAVLSKWGGGGAREYLLYRNGAAFQFYVSNDGSAITFIACPTVLVTGQWYFVVAWHDSVANTINIQLDNGTVTSTAHSTGVFDGSSPFYIGREQTNYFSGRIDQAFVTKRVFTTQERTDLYNGGSGLAYSNW